jgi:hypothetical protein
VNVEIIPNLGCFALKTRECFLVIPQYLEEYWLEGLECVQSVVLKGLNDGMTLSFT